MNLVTFYRTGDGYRPGFFFHIKHGYIEEFWHCDKASLTTSSEEVGKLIWNPCFHACEWCPNSISIGFYLPDAFLLVNVHWLVSFRVSDTLKFSYNIVNITWYSIKQSNDKYRGYIELIERLPIWASYGVSIVASFLENLNKIMV